MRIPTSVIVMSLLTAAPFGLAIRDTLTKKQPVVEDEDDYGYRGSPRRDREALAEYEREMAREAEERATKRAAALRSLDDLYGKTPASMGSLFSGVVLGADAGSFQPEDARERIERASRDGFMSVEYDVDAVALRAVIVRVEDGSYDYESTTDPCATLRNKLVTAWGPSNNGTWLDASTHQRAHMSSTDCTLTFSTYLEPTEWVAALPFSAINAKADTYLASVPYADVDDQSATWRIRGIGAGAQDTTITAFIDKGKIKGFTASTNADYDTLVAVREAVAAKLKGQPTLDDYGDVWTWNKKVPAELRKMYDGRFELFVGDDPWD